MGCTSSVTVQPEKRKKNKVPKFLKEKKPEYQIRVDICNLKKQTLQIDNTTPTTRTTNNDPEFTTLTTKNTQQTATSLKNSISPISEIQPDENPSKQFDFTEKNQILKSKTSDLDLKFNRLQINALLYAQNTMEQSPENSTQRTRTVIVNDHLVHQSVPVPVLPASLAASSLFRKRIKQYNTQIQSIKKTSITEENEEIFQGMELSKQEYD